MSKGQTSTIYAGQLAVDMYDSKNHHLAWRGVVSKALDPTATPDMQEKILKKSVAKLLTNYPPSIDIPGATGTYRVPILGYYHSFGFFGRAANVSALLLDGVGDFHGKVLCTDFPRPNVLRMLAIVQSDLTMENQRIAFVPSRRTRDAKCIVQRGREPRRANTAYARHGQSVHPKIPLVRYQSDARRHAILAAALR